MFKSVPEAKSMEPMEPIEVKSMEPTEAEFAAAEPEGTGSEMAAASKAAPAEAASGKVRATKAVTEATPPRKADALNVEPAVAIAAATKPIAILRIMMLTPFVLSTPSLSESNPAVPSELRCAALYARRPGFALSPRSRWHPRFAAVRQGRMQRSGDGSKVQSVLF
jgi:hypothetical protein